MNRTAPATAGATLAIWLQPGASRERIVGMVGDALKVAVAAPPEKGKANAALERLLAEELGLSRGSVRVVAGATSRRKVVRIEGISPQVLQDWVARFRVKG